MTGFLTSRGIFLQQNRICEDRWESQTYKEIHMGSILNNGAPKLYRV